MKALRYILLFLIGAMFLYSCEEQVDTPSPDFYIEVADPDEGNVNLPEPYQVKVGQSFTVISSNTAEFNSFWPGDTIYSSGGDTIIQIYDDNLTIQHSGLKLGDEGLATYAYEAPGNYNYTFVSVNMNAGASTVEIATKSGNIKVTE